LKDRTNVIKELVFQGARHHFPFQSSEVCYGVYIYSFIHPFIHSFIHSFIFAFLWTRADLYIYTRTSVKRTSQMIRRSLDPRISLYINPPLLFSNTDDFFFLPSSVSPTPFSQSDEEPVDPIADVRKECYKTCPKQQKLYDACVQRITEKKEGDCEAWFIELLSCADKCVAPKIFKLTKE